METFTALLKQIGQIFRWWVIVAPWEQGLRVRAGKHVCLLSPGIHVRIPYFDQAFVQSSRLRVIHLAMQTVLTKDRKPLTVGATIQYAIKDIRKLYDSLHHAQDTIGNLAAVEISDRAAEINADELTPSLLSEQATAQIELERYGLADAKVRVTDFAFVKTYRLISDTRWGAYGASLDVERPTA